MAKIAIIGASIGGLIAASILRDKNHDVTIFEKSNKPSGLYSKVLTPFGEQELGMHVIYANKFQLDHLLKICGENSFTIKTGPHVDLGSSYAFGKLNTNSVYPDIRGTIFFEKILNELTSQVFFSLKQENNLEFFLKNRFGVCATNLIHRPLIKKIWSSELHELTSNAIHCFMDLRRLVVADKKQTDIYKDNILLDQVIANPDQLNPYSSVYSGRYGVFLNGKFDINSNIMQWCLNKDVKINFNQDIQISNHGFKIEEKYIECDFDAFIISAPLHNIYKIKDLEYRSLSIYYVKTKNNLPKKFYYTYVHDTQFKSIRVVNYSAYNFDNDKNKENVIAVEVLHEKLYVPSELEIVQELECMFPDLKIVECYKFPNSLEIVKPTIKNALKIDEIEIEVKQNSSKSIYFAGMRTDKGIFFSHQTIGVSNAAALDCSRRFD